MSESAKLQPDGISSVITTESLIRAYSPVTAAWLPELPLEGSMPYSTPLRGAFVCRLVEPMSWLLPNNEPYDELLTPYCKPNGAPLNPLAYAHSPLTFGPEHLLVGKTLQSLLVS